MPAASGTGEQKSLAVLLGVVHYNYMYLLKYVLYSPEYMWLHFIYNRPAVLRASFKLHWCHG